MHKGNVRQTYSPRSQRPSEMSESPEAAAPYSLALCPWEGSCIISRSLSTKVSSIHTLYFY